MLNNRGQSLVMFVMIIPVLLIVIIIVMDVGKMYLVRRELDNINYIALDYGLDNLGIEDINDKINEIILKNDDEIIIVGNKIEENKIYLTIKKKYEGFFIGLIGDRSVDITSAYLGYQEEGKKYIERVK